MSLPRDIFFNLIGFGLALALGITTLFTSPLLAAAMFIAATLFATWIYENWKGKPQMSRAWAIGVAVFELAVSLFFIYLIYEILVTLPYLSPLDIDLFLILVESVLVVWGVFMDVKEAIEIVRGVPVVLRYVGPVEVRHYVKEVREED